MRQMARGDTQWFRKTFMDIPAQLLSGDPRVAYAGSNYHHQGIIDTLDETLLISAHRLSQRVTESLHATPLRHCDETASTSTQPLAN